MDPLRLIAYAAAIAIAALLALGGLGFYAGYSAGRRDIAEVKSYIAAARLNLPAGAPGKDGAPAATITLEPGALDPVMTELRALGETVAELQQRVASGGGRSQDDAQIHEEAAQLRQKLAEALKEEGRLKEELVAVRQRLGDGSKSDSKLAEELSAARTQLAQQASQANACQSQLASLEKRLKDSEAAKQTASAHCKGDAPARSAAAGGGSEAGAVVIFDSVTLKRSQSKVYSDVDVLLNLESVGARAVKLAVNHQSISVNFGERKVIQHNDATCELVLMESDLETAQARFNITCRR